jgi:hypothetical protein
MTHLHYLFFDIIIIGHEQTAVVINQIVVEAIMFILGVADVGSVGICIVGLSYLIDEGITILVLLQILTEAAGGIAAGGLLIPEEFL